MTPYTGSPSARRCPFLWKIKVLFANKTESMSIQVKSTRAYEFCCIRGLGGGGEGSTCFPHFWEVSNLMIRMNEKVKGFNWTPETDLSHLQIVYVALEYVSCLPA